MQTQWEIKKFADMMEGFHHTLDNEDGVLLAWKLNAIAKADDLCEMGILRFAGGTDVVADDICSHPIAVRAYVYQLTEAGKLLMRNGTQ